MDRYFQQNSLQCRPMAPECSVGIASIGIATDGIGTRNRVLPSVAVTLCQAMPLV